MSLKVDTSIFSAMCRELAEKCEAPDDEALRYEVGRVLSRAVELTPAADVNKMRRHAQNAKFSLQPTSLYATKRKRRATLHGGRIVYDLANRYPDALWQRLQKARLLDIAKRLKARGLAKGSWWKCGQRAGLNVDAPAYAKKAVPTTGKEYPQDERGKTIRQSGEIVYEIENSQPTAVAVHGEQILQQAIDGRVDYFLTNVKKGVFDSWDRIAKKYAGVTVSG